MHINTHGVTSIFSEPSEITFIPLTKRCSLAHSLARALFIFSEQLNGAIMMAIKDRKIVENTRFNNASILLIAYFLSLSYP
ncbi:MAG TPA: hypothetical protein PK444_06705 [Syntrophorhabdaceae bacterium]|nr:hypothetical protein [Syntrophorhabdaceae bacterium]